MALSDYISVSVEAAGEVVVRGGGTSCVSQPSDWIRPLIYLQHRAIKLTTTFKFGAENTQPAWTAGNTEHWHPSLGINFSFLPTSDQHSCHFFLFANFI